MKKILALIMAILMIACTFSSCGMGDDLWEDIKDAWGGNSDGDENNLDYEDGVNDWIDGDYIIDGEDIINGEKETDGANNGNNIETDGMNNGNNTETDGNNGDTNNDNTNTDNTNTDNTNTDNTNTDNTNNDNTNNDNTNNDNTNNDNTNDNNNNGNVDNNNNDDNSNETYIRTGEKITFGSYPQTEVKDSALISTLNSKAGTFPTSENSQEWMSYGYYIEGEVKDYMWYIDVEHGGEKYRGVYFTSYRSYFIEYESSIENTNQDDNGYNTGIAYWFKYEPISWTILSENNIDGTVFVLCDMIIDAQEYYAGYDDERIIDNQIISPNNYAHSNIRKWLNDDFYNVAFDDLQKALIVETIVDNSSATTDDMFNEYACENTQDKIFALSYKDILNINYGFDSSEESYDKARQKSATDYSKSQGAYVPNEGEYANNGFWWLRSSSYCDGDDVRSVFYDGCADYYYGTLYTCITFVGIVPALQIKLV